jgi:uridine kinase
MPLGAPFSLSMNEIYLRIKSAIRKLIPSTNLPVLIAIDGGSGAGKTTVTKTIEELLNAAVIHLDDFYSADIPYRKWQGFSVEEKFQNVFRWNELREEVLEPLKSGCNASWFAFDFNASSVDGTYALEKDPKSLKPTDVVILEGAYSASPHLDGLIDFSILVDVPIDERHERLDKRESEDFLIGWHNIWDDVEKYYFNEVRPREYFDLIIS